MTPLTTTTASDGSYSFGSLRPGTYSVAVAQPTGFLAGMDSIGTVAGSADGKLASSTAGVFTNVVLGQGNAGVNYNFGELQPTSISGFVYVDANNDGKIEAGETGLSGVTLSYVGVTDIGGVVTGSATTDSTGAYTFGNLRPGAYTVSITEPAGYFAGLAAIGGSPIAGTQTNPVIGGVRPRQAAPRHEQQFRRAAPGVGGGLRVRRLQRQRRQRRWRDRHLRRDRDLGRDQRHLGASVSVTLTTRQDGSRSALATCGLAHTA